MPKSDKMWMDKCCHGIVMLESRLPLGGLLFQTSKIAAG